MRNSFLILFVVFLFYCCKSTSTKINLLEYRHERFLIYSFMKDCFIYHSDSSKVWLPSFKLKPVKEIHTGEKFYVIFSFFNEDEEIVDNFEDCEDVTLAVYDDEFCEFLYLASVNNVIYFAKDNEAIIRRFAIDISSGNLNYGSNNDYLLYLARESGYF